jgi:uracil DNA glycosylase
MIKLSNSWLKILKKEFEKDYIKNIENFLETEKNS